MTSNHVDENMNASSPSKMRSNTSNVWWNLFHSTFNNILIFHKINLIQFTQFVNSSPQYVPLVFPDSLLRFPPGYHHLSRSKLVSLSRAFPNVSQCLSWTLFLSDLPGKWCTNQNLLYNYYMIQPSDLYGSTYIHHGDRPIPHRAIPHRTNPHRANPHRANPHTKFPTGQIPHISILQY